MQSLHRIFVGYFSKNFPRKHLARYVLGLVSHPRALSIHATACGGSCHVYYCCIGFAKPGQADRALKILAKQRYHGLPLVVHRWEDRTAANERRRANWRNNLRLGPERRRADRRHYRHEAMPAMTEASVSSPPPAPQPTAADPRHSAGVFAVRDEQGPPDVPESALTDSGILIRTKF